MRLRVYTVTTILFILISTTLIPALAQDTPTPEPTLAPTASETPTETATLTLTPTDPPTLTLAPTDAPAPTNTDAPTATEAATLAGTPSETPTASATLDGTLTETATASASPTASETPTETATATLLPPEPGLELIYDERFDGGAYPFDMLLNARGRLTRLGSEIALSIRQNDAPVTVTPFFLADAVLQARFALNSGAVVLETRATDVGGYRAVIGLDGQVQLFRNGVLLASGSAPAATAGQWRTLRLSTIGDVLRVSVDGIEVLTATDSDPLFTGNLRFSGNGMNASGLLIDDIAVFVRVPDQATKADTTNARLAAQSYYTFPRGDQMILVNSGLSSFSANGSQQVSANGSEPFISADGRQLMTACGTYQVCVSDAEGDNEQFLAVHPDHASNFNYPGGFSPSGLWALYLTQTDLTDELWAVNLRSGALRQVYSQDIMMFYPLDDWHWGRDGNIYFARFEDGIFQISSPTNGAPSVDLVVSQTDFFGTLQTNVGCEDNGLDDIAVNADGEIAFTQICLDGGFSGEILIVKRQGYQIIFVISTELIGRIGGTQWVPDGTNELIAISQTGAYLFSGDFYGVQILDADENALNQTYLSVNANTLGTGRIAWGIDRATTSFFLDCSTTSFGYSFVADFDLDLEIYRALNGLCSPLTVNAVADTAPEYSSDGTQLAFVRADPDNAGETEIYLINADGSNERRLTTGSGIKSNPAWSPDGTQIVYDYTDNGVTYLYAINVNGSNNRSLNFNEGSNAAWSPNGQWIVYVDNAGELRLVESGCVLPTCVDVELTSYNANWSALAAPEWSPDGQSFLAVELNAADGAILWRMFVIYDQNQQPETVTGYNIYAADRLGEPDWSVTLNQVLIDAQSPTDIDTEIMRFANPSSVALGASTQLTYDDLDNQYPRWQAGQIGTPTPTPTPTATPTPIILPTDCAYAPIPTQHQSDDPITDDVDESQFASDIALRTSPATPPGNANQLRNTAFWGIKINQAGQPIDSGDNVIYITDWANISAFNPVYLTANRITKATNDRAFTPIRYYVETQEGNRIWLLIDYNGALAWIAQINVNLNGCGGLPSEIDPNDPRLDLETYYDSILPHSIGVDAPAPNPADYKPFGECLAGVALESSWAACAYELYVQIYNDPRFQDGQGNTTLLMRDLFGILMFGEAPADLPLLPYDDLSQPYQYFVEAAARNVATVCGAAPVPVAQETLSCNMKGMIELLLQVQSFYQKYDADRESFINVDSAVGVNPERDYRSFAERYADLAFSSNQNWWQGSVGTVPVQWGNWLSSDPNEVYLTAQRILDGQVPIPDNVEIIRGNSPWVHVREDDLDPLLVNGNVFAIQNVTSSGRCPSYTFAITTLSAGLGQTSSCGD